jgi:hypothetical protein
MIILPPRQNPWVDLSQQLGQGMTQFAQLAMQREQMDRMNRLAEIQAQRQAATEAFQHIQGLKTLQAIQAQIDQANRVKNFQDIVTKLMTPETRMTTNIPESPDIAYPVPPTGEVTLPQNWELMKRQIAGAALQNLAPEHAAPYLKAFEPKEEAWTPSAGGEIIVEKGTGKVKETGYARPQPEKNLNIHYTTDSQGNQWKVTSDPITGATMSKENLGPIGQKPTAGEGELKAGKLKLMNETIERLYSQYSATPQRGLVYVGLPQGYKGSFDWVKRKAEGYLETMNPEAVVGQALKDYHEQYNKAYRPGQPGSISVRDKATSWLKENNAPVTDANVQAVIKKFGW